MSGDIFVAESSSTDALVLQLHTITYLTSDKRRADRVLREGFRLDAGEWIKSDDRSREKLNAYLGLDESMNWEACAYTKSGEGQNVQIRLICLDEETSAVRPEIDGSYVGGASIGFPMEDLYKAEKEMALVELDSSIGVKEMEFQGPTGEVYISAEIHFLGMENIFLLGVKRPDIFVPVGPIDTATGIGAPAYSARCVANTDEVIGFLKDILGFEIRRDVNFPVGENSGLRLREGSDERFVQAFAPGSCTGYLVLLDHTTDTKKSPATTLGPPSRGMVMWSFPTANLDAVHDKAAANNIEIMQAPAHSGSPFLPNNRTMILKDPGGFPIEIFEV